MWPLLGFVAAAPVWERAVTGVRRSGAGPALCPAVAEVLESWWPARLDPEDAAVAAASRQGPSAMGCSFRDEEPEGRPDTSIAPHISDYVREGTRRWPR